MFCKSLLSLFWVSSDFFAGVWGFLYDEFQGCALFELPIKIFDGFEFVLDLIGINIKLTIVVIVCHSCCFSRIDRIDKLSYDAKNVKYSNKVVYSK